MAGRADGTDRRRTVGPALTGWHEALRERAAAILPERDPDRPSRRRLATPHEEPPTPSAAMFAHRIAETLANAADGLTAEQIADTVGARPGAVGLSLIRNQGAFVRTGERRSIPSRYWWRGMPSTVWTLRRSDG